MNNKLLIAGFLLLTLLFAGCVLIPEKPPWYGLYTGYGTGNTTIYECGLLNSSNEVYTLNQSINTTGSCLTFGTVENITIDCAGFTITGTDATNSRGVFSLNHKNVSVKNCNFVSFKANAIYATGETTGAVIDNINFTATNAQANAIYVAGSNVIISNIKVIDGSTSHLTGILLEGLSNSKVYNFNIANGSSYGIRLYGSSTNNIISNGTLTNCKFVIGDKGDGTGGTNTGNNITNISISGAAQTHLMINKYSNNNRFSLLNFSATSAVYVNDTKGGNFYNFTYLGINQGNIYANVLNGSIAIQGTANSSITGLFIGTQGTGFPYSNSTSGGKFSCNFAGCADYAPLTNDSRTNTAPTITAISVIPAGATQLSTISCNLTATDPEQATLNVTGNWSKNGAIVTALAFTYNNLANNTATLVSNVTSGNLTGAENWSCSATVFDGTAYSSLNTSANLTLGTVSTQVLIRNSTGGYNAFNFSGGQMSFRCTNPFPSWCQAQNQNNATSTPILVVVNNGSADSAYRQIKTNETWNNGSWAELWASATTAPTLNVSTTLQNYSTTTVGNGTNQSLYMWLYIKEVPANFPRSFNLTIENS